MRTEQSRGPLFSSLTVSKTTVRNTANLNSTLQEIQPSLTVFSLYVELPARTIADVRFPCSYEDASTSVLNKKSSHPTLTNVVNTASAVSYTEGGTFVTVGEAQDFDAIFSIDENNFAGPGSRVGNGKSTSYFWAQICYEMASSTVYSPSSSVKCSSSIYCVPGPKDTTDL